MERLINSIYSGSKQITVLLKIQNIQFLWTLLFWRVIFLINYFTHFKEHPFHDSRSKTNSLVQNNDNNIKPHILFKEWWKMRFV